MDPLLWDFPHPKIGNRIKVIAETAEKYVRIHVAHAFIVPRDDGDGLDVMRSMTGQIYTIKIWYHVPVARTEYSWAVANDRLEWSRIFYPSPKGSPLDLAKAWYIKTAIRLMRKFWREHYIKDEPDKIKELKHFVKTALESIQEVI